MKERLFTQWKKDSFYFFSPPSAPSQERRDGGREEEGEFTKKSQEFRKNGSLSEAGEKRQLAETAKADDRKLSPAVLLKHPRLPRRKRRRSN